MQALFACSSAKAHSHPPLLKQHCPPDMESAAFRDATCYDAAGGLLPSSAGGHRSWQLRAVPNHGRAVAVLNALDAHPAATVSH